MGYISVKEAAERFNISERRIQKLCETNRIDGAQMVSNVWIIPSNAKKPKDERMITTPENSDVVTLRELCNEISISITTGRNWMKLNKITPEYIENGTPFFSKTYVKELKMDIKSGANSALKSRRNKKYVSGSSLYHSYVSDTSVNVKEIQKIIDVIINGELQLTNEQISLLIAECAIQLILQREGEGNSEKQNVLSSYLAGRLSLGDYQQLIDDLVGEYKSAEKFIFQNPKLFEVQYVYEEREDILGLLYISIKNIGNRKATGVYYTPTKVVKQLINKICEKSSDINDKIILDPCCGTGNFLLQLPDSLRVEQIYGNDIDAISVKVTRVNMALKYRTHDMQLLYRNITESNYLASDKKDSFDYIIGNPPWGYDFVEEEKDYLRKHFITAIGKNIESYDVFVEHALSQLKMNGILSFVLPEAILNVKTHLPIRNVIAAQNSIQYLEFLGNVFDKVQCPCIIMQLLHNGQNISCIGMEVNDGSKCYTLHKERIVESECFSFNTTDTEYAIISKILNISNKVTLKGNATFALGIVTGNNKEYISSIHTEENEIILKGSDLNKFKVKESKNYIAFLPEQFQQVAPTEYYRAPEKLLYRFICNQLVFAYDDKQTLSLNSCNLVIPNIDGLEMKYIMAILNSRIAQFIFTKQFNSVKVLRSHIEQIPIPDIDVNDQVNIVNIVDELCRDVSNETMYELYERLDKKIATLYNLQEDEYAVILKSLEGENNFLC